MNVFVLKYNYSDDKGELLLGSKYTFPIEIAGGNEDFIIPGDISFSVSDLAIVESEDFTGDLNITEIEKPIKQGYTEHKSTILVYDEDRIIDFKQKIQIATGIPMYRQHLYYIIRGKVIPLSYKLQTTILQKVDARDIPNSTDYIDGVPVDVTLYNKREDILVESYDEFRIIKDIRNLSINDFYVLDCNDFFINRSQFEAHLGDSYTKELIYYSFIIKYWPMMTLDIFTMYIKNENDIKLHYPALFPDTATLEKKFDREREFIDKLNSVNSKDLKIVQSNMLIGITSAILYQKNTSEISIRNLFDKFQLSDVTPYMRCRTSINGTLIDLTKRYKFAHVFREKMGSNSALISVQIKLPNGLYTIASLIIHSSGTYYVQTSWRDDFYIDFKNLYSIVEKNINPIITRINNMNRYVIDKPLTVINAAYTKITDMSMSIYWKQSLSSGNFKKLTDVLSSMASGGIITPRQTLGSTNEYIFIKGMYKFNHLLLEDLVKGITNYYTRFSDPNVKQKWEGLFDKNRIYKIHHRYGDIKFDILNIREEEKDIVYNYTSRIITLIQNQLSNELDIQAVDRKLRKLKEVDPELYDFKKAYQSTEILSKKCQKPLQPVIYTKNEYIEKSKTMNAEDKKRILEYWNFTSGESAYYECPDKKYPYARFITGVHPKGYCIPCCKKTQVSRDKENRKTILHNSCMTEHTFDDATVDQKKSRYISFYGKDLDPGRLSYLPEDQLGALFYDHGGINDEECRKSEEYLILGVNQCYDNKQLGIVSTISVILDIPPAEIISTVFAYIKKNSNEFHTILDGNIHLYSSDINDLIHRWKLPNNQTINIMPVWNDIFLSMISLVYNYRFIIFRVVENQAFIDIPNTLQIVDSYFPQNVGLILQKNADRDSQLKHYYPIINANKDTFYKLGEIAQKTFTLNDKIIISIWNMINIRIKKQGDYRAIIDLYTIETFCRSSKYSIKKYYINNKHNAYAVLLTNGKSIVHVPINLSYHNSNINVEYYPFMRSSLNLSTTNTMAFIKEYNDFAKSDGKFPRIDIEFWLYLMPLGSKTGNYIGFSSQGLNFYCTGTRSTSAPDKRLYYDPDMVNKSIINVKSTLDNRAGHMALYNKYLYQMIMLEFINLFSQEYNKPLRKKIISLVLGTNFKSTSMHFIDDVLKDHPHDITAIKSLISEYLYDHNNKQKLVNAINKGNFMFDKMLLTQLIAIKDRPTLIARLLLVSKKIIVEQNISSTEFPNVFLACSEGAVEKHCVNKKLMVPKGKLKPLLDIFASDIQNPLKSSIMFTRLFINTVIDPYKFQKFPHEDINVQII